MEEKNEHSVLNFLFVGVLCSERKKKYFMHSVYEWCYVFNKETRHIFMIFMIKN